MIISIIFLISDIKMLAFNQITTMIQGFEQLLYFDFTLNQAWIFPCEEEPACCPGFHPVMLWLGDHNLIDQAKK